MKIASFGSAMGLGLVLTTGGLGWAPVAAAHAGQMDAEACAQCMQEMRRQGAACEDCEMERPGGGGGMPGMRAMRMMKGASLGHKHVDLVIQPFVSQSRSAVYTLIGMEMVKQDALGWKGGFGMYGGMNLGVTSQSNVFQYGGGLLGKDFTAGPLSLTTGLLLGFGKTSDILPTVFPAGVQNTYLFGVAAPRIGLAWTVYNRMEIGLDASYLFTSNPNVGNGPALSLRFSRIGWGRGGW